MANIPLQSITFPGLADKYTTPTVDSTLTQTGAAADAKKTGDEIAELKNDLNQFPNGTYPNMSVGNADQLTATVGIEDNTPYLFRTSGGSNDIGDREDVRKIVGGTVVNNQLISSMGNSRTNNGITVTVSPDKTSASFSGTFTSRPDYGQLALTQTVTLKRDGRKYLFYANQALPLSMGVSGYGPMSVNGSNNQFFIWTRSDGTNWGAYAIMHVPENYEGITLDISDLTINIFDLTQMFGTSIADYVYSLETATAGAGVAWLKKHFPAQFDAGYQAYDAGSLQSVSGLTAHKMVGFNQWDEEWELGSFNGGNGQKATNSDKIRSKNYIPVLPNTVYYFQHTAVAVGGADVFMYDSNKTYLGYVNYGVHEAKQITTPSNACFMMFTILGTTYNHDICINLSWDGERDGEYEPYVEYTYPLDDSLTLRGIPKLDSNNQLYYDGDEYLPDGTVNRRYGVVDLGTLDWEYYSSQSRFTSPMTGVKTPVNNSTKASIICTKYPTVATNDNIETDKTIGLSIYSSLGIKDLSFGTDSAAFKTAMSGVYLVYELATPTTETALPYQETQIVDDFGTEEFVFADSAFPVPVGHETYYKNNLRAKLEMSPDSPDGDGLYVVQQENGQNEYVPLASTSTIQDILTRLTALENENT